MTSRLSIAAIRQRLTPFLCFTMLVFFVIGNLQVESLHQFLHSHQHTVSHTEVQESDPCHRSLYHNDQKRGCGHQSHLIVSDKCELCDLITHSDAIVLSSPDSISNNYFTTEPVICSASVLSIGQSNLPSRAPPVFFIS
jgi:hypothetical protein